MTISVKLIKPIEAHGETVNAIHLREPNAEDIAKCGYIVSSFVHFSEPDVEEVRVNAGAVLKYIVQLGNIPKSSADKICPADFVALTREIRSFFEESPPPTTNE